MQLNQPTTAIHILIDAAGDSMLAWRRWDPVTGRQLTAGTYPTCGVPELAAALGEILGHKVEITETAPIAAPAMAREHTRVQLCGCVYVIADGSLVSTCRQHTVIA